MGEVVDGRLSYTNTQHHSVHRQVLMVYCRQEFYRACAREFNLAFLKFKVHHLIKILQILQTLGPRFVIRVFQDSFL